MAEAGPSSPLPPKKSGSKETVQDFDELLKRTVKDKRLSGTNVQKVSDLAIRLLKHDVRLIASINKLHRSLPARSPQKVHSLYTLHSIAGAVKKLLNRYAKAEDGMDQASKRALCETFLSKLESIVGGISDDMLDVEGDGTWMEGREKMRKIADIWRKDQVFSTGLIATLQDKIKTAELRAAASEVTKSLASATTANEQQQLGKDKGASTMAAGNSGDAQGQGQLAQSSPPPPPLLPNPANFGNLLDILAAAGKNAGASPSTTAGGQAPAAPSFTFDPNQLSALAKIAAVTQHQQHQQQQHPADSPPPPSSHQPYVQPRIARQVPPSQNSYQDAMAKRDEIARRLNGLGPGVSSMSSRPEASPVPSTSQFDPDSAPGAMRRASPSAESRYAHESYGRARAEWSASSGMNGQGRRSASPPPRSSIDDRSRFDPRPRSPPRHRRERSGSGEADMQIDASPPPPDAPPARPAQPETTLATFDMTSFNPGDPSSWERLGKAWAATHGKPPNEMELMMYVMNGGNVMGGMAGMGAAAGMMGMGL